MRTHAVWCRAGFYRSGYTDVEGNAQIMASTQFESLDARRCFPCVDEPSAKAVFAVTLTVQAHLQVLSNMPVSNFRTDSLQKKTVQFLDTPSMSTYLLAMCVGQFDCVSTVTDHGVVVSVHTPPGKSDSGVFALDCAKRCLDAYNDFFGVHFPLPKMDMIAIPEFAMGASTLLLLFRSCLTWHFDNLSPLYCGSMFRRNGNQQWKTGDW